MGPLDQTSQMFFHIVLRHFPFRSTALVAYCTMKTQEIGLHVVRRLASLGEHYDHEEYADVVVTFVRSLLGWPSFARPTSLMDMYAPTHNAKRILICILSAISTTRVPEISGALVNIPGPLDRDTQRRPVGVAR